MMANEDPAYADMRKALKEAQDRLQATDAALEAARAVNAQLQKGVDDLEGQVQTASRLMLEHAGHAGEAKRENVRLRRMLRFALNGGLEIGDTDREEDED